MNSVNTSEIYHSMILRLSCATEHALASGVVTTIGSELTGICGRGRIPC